MSDPFDPQEPEEGRRSNQYVSRKDLRIIAIVLLVLALAGWPIYVFMLGGVNRSLCERNFRKIALAMSQYADDCDLHMPYAYETASYESSEVGLKANGYAYTWQWSLNRYIGDPKAFRCPAAQPIENAKTSDGTFIESSSYGMLNAYSGVNSSIIANPGQKFMISETSNHGALGTYDPLPLRVEGKPQNDDGYVIGFDNAPDYPNLQSKNATRLAFPGSSNGVFNEETNMRHPGGIHFLYLDGHLGLLDAKAARVILLSGGFGSWDVPKPDRRF